MQRGFKGNALLIELLIVILFFSISAAVDLSMFGRAHEDAKASRAVSEAMVLCQDWAERLCAADDPEGLLLENGWSADGDGAMSLEEKDVRLIAQWTVETAPRGEVMRGSVGAYSGEEALFLLPMARYSREGGEPL